MRSVQAQQLQSMEAGATWEAWQALGGPHANTSRSASFCIPTTQQACVCQPVPTNYQTVIVMPCFLTYCCNAAQLLKCLATHCSCCPSASLCHCLAFSCADTLRCKALLGVNSKPMIGMCDPALVNHQVLGTHCYTCCISAMGCCTCLCPSITAISWHNK